MLSGFLLGVHSAAFSADGQRLVTVSNGTEAIKVWDAISLQELTTMEGRGSILQQMAFSPDGNVLGAKSFFGKGVLNLWRAPSWREIETAEKPR